MPSIHWAMAQGTRNRVLSKDTPGRNAASRVRKKAVKLISTIEYT
jgi:hypothetical protein